MPIQICEKCAYLCRGNIAAKLKSKIMVNVTFKVERKVLKDCNLQFIVMFEREVSLESLIGVSGIIESLHKLYPAADCRVVVLVENSDNWK